MVMIVLMDSEYETLLTMVVRLKQHFERELATTETDNSAAAKRARIQHNLKNIKSVLAATCRHSIVTDEIEYIRGLEPRLETIRFCEICELSASECGL